MNILEQFHQRPFQPRSVQQFLALQIARTLNDLEYLPLYIRASEQLPIEKIVSTIKKACSSSIDDASGIVRKDLNNALQT